MCGKRRSSSAYCWPSSAGLPVSNSVALSISAWLRRDEFARTPRKRVNQSPPCKSIGEMRRVGAIEHVVGGSLSVPASTALIASSRLSPVGSLPSVSTVACMRMRCARREQRVKDLSRPSSNATARFFAKRSWPGPQSWRRMIGACPKAARVDRLDRARRSYGERAWAGAFQACSDADLECSLEAQDLVQLALAAYRVGREEE